MSISSITSTTLPPASMIDAMSLIALACVLSEDELPTLLSAPTIVAAAPASSCRLRDSTTLRIATVTFASAEFTAVDAPLTERSAVVAEPTICWISAATVELAPALVRRAFVAVTTIWPIAEARSAAGSEAVCATYWATSASHVVSVAVAPQAAVMFCRSVANETACAEAGTGTVNAAVIAAVAIIFFILLYKFLPSTRQHATKMANLSRNLQV